MRPLRVPPSGLVVHSLRGLVEGLPVTVVAGLVYGSVAKGRHRPDSDVDALLVTAGPVSPIQHQAVVDTYANCVSGLGLRVDDEYPVEVFSLDACCRMLGITDGPQRQGGRDDAFRCSPEDAWEVLYALTTPHLVVTGEPLVWALHHAARRRLAALAQQMTPPPHDLDIVEPPTTTK